MTDTARARRRDPAGDDAARAPRRGLLLGPPLLHLNEPAIAPLGEAKPNTEAFRLLAARTRPRRPRASPRPTRSCSSALFDGAPDGVDLAELRERGCAKVDLGQGEAPHAEGNFAHGADRRAAATLRRAVLRAARRGRRHGAGERFPLALITPKTHLFLNSTFANQAPPARRPARAVRRRASRRRRRARRSPTAPACAPQRPRRVHVRRARLRRHPPGRDRRADGLVERRLRRAGGAQATTSQRLTELGTRRPSTTTGSRSS